MQQIALLGATASGKTSLALELASKYNGVILSLDSLSIYKEIDIASAKPTLEERGKIKHFGIDVIKPNETFNVTLFFELYKKAKEYAVFHKKMLIVVGGTSFYLKAMVSGLSEKPTISKATQELVLKALQDVQKVFSKVAEIDPKYAQNITKNDSYRMEKWLEIHYETGQIPSEYMQKTLQKPLIESIPIYELVVDREELRKKIALRTKLMIEDGLVDEVVGLERKYGRDWQCMKAIGIKEVLAYLDGEYLLEEMEEKITINTVKLAKRQRTFNKTQFGSEVISGDYETLMGMI